MSIYLKYKCSDICYLVQSIAREKHSQSRNSNFGEREDIVQKGTSDGTTKLTFYHISRMWNTGTCLCKTKLSQLTL